MPFKEIANSNSPTIALSLILAAFIYLYIKSVNQRDMDYKSLVEETTNTNRELLKTNSRFAEQLTKNTEILDGIKDTLRELPEMKNDISVIKAKLRI